MSHAVAHLSCSCSQDELQRQAPTKVEVLAAVQDLLLGPNSNTIWSALFTTLLQTGGRAITRDRKLMDMTIEVRANP